MRYPVLFIILIFFLFVKNNNFSNEFDFNPSYKYKNIIDFIKSRSDGFSNQSLSVIFASLKSYGILDEDLILIDKNDFIIIYLEYVILYSYYYKFEKIINDSGMQSTVEDKEQLIDLTKKIDNFYEAIYIEKIKKYIHYKKNNKNCDGLVDSCVILISAFLDAFLENNNE